MVKQPYIITKSVHETLELDRLEYLRKLSKKTSTRDLANRYIGSDFKFDRGRAYLMGGIGNKITHLYQFPNDCGGCHYLPSIRSLDFSKGIMYLAESGVSFMGLARTGQFHTDAEFDNLGSGVVALADKIKKLMLLSFGRNGMKFQEVTVSKCGDEKLKTFKIRIGK